MFRGLGRFNRGLVLIGFRTTGARSTIFPEIGFLHPSDSPSVIFHLKKKVLKKSEYRRRNEHISFLTGSKNSSLESHQYDVYALNRDGFHGKYHESRHSRALIGLVIREGVASFMWAAFVCIARYFFERCFLKSIFRFERDTLKSYNSKGICPFYVKFGEQLV